VENVEVRYAGVGIGRATHLRDWSEAGAFVGFAEPMPTGTPLVLKGDGIEQPARVVQSIESADAAVAGMRVVFLSAAEVTSPRSAAPAAVAPAVAAPESPPEAAVAPAVAAPESPAPAPAAPASAAPGETSEASASLASAEAGAASDVPGPAESPDAAAASSANEGDAGVGGSSGKRRRRRR
jgi:hypothetical protein